MTNMTSNEERKMRILRKRAFRYQKGLCYWCNRPMNANASDGIPNKLTAEHLIPRCEGGKTIEGNVVAACLKCNNRRYHKSKELLIKSVGDNRPRSPFECLSKS